MSKIWKQPLKLTGMPLTEITSGHAEVVHVGLDPTGLPCVWFWAPGSGPRDYDFMIALVGTGNELDEIPPGHVGSFVYGSLMLHAYATRRDAL